jgi:hypothetical protein
MQYFKRTATIKKVSETEYQLVTTDTNEVLKTGTLQECDEVGLQFYLDQLGDNAEQKFIDIMKDFVNKNKPLLDTYLKLKSNNNDSKNDNSGEKPIS